MQLTAYVAPADTEASTCEAPTGKVQFYVNNKPYGDPVSLEDCDGADDVNAAGRKQSVAKINWTPTQNGGKYAVDGTQEIYAKYIVQDKDNYNKSDADSVSFDIQTVDQGNEAIGGQPIEVTESFHPLTTAVLIRFTVIHLRLSLQGEIRMKLLFM